MYPFVVVIHEEHSLSELKAIEFAPQPRTVVTRLTVTSPQLSLRGTKEDNALHTS